MSSNSKARLAEAGVQVERLTRLMNDDDFVWLINVLEDRKDIEYKRIHNLNRTVESFGDIQHRLGFIEGLDNIITLHDKLTTNYNKLKKAVTDDESRDRSDNKRHHNWFAGK